MKLLQVFCSLGLTLSPSEPGEHASILCLTLKPFSGARHWWLMPVILATQEAKIRRMMV
jgi:hypothetical protein